MIKTINVMDEKWDYLIVLDACRYDYFSKLYKFYLKGEIKKAYSTGACTWEWLKKSFPEYYNDVVYVSANPYINSKIDIKGVFNAKNHFFRVIDVWDWGWDEILGTVHPRKVNETVQKIKDKYWDKKFIIHYLQPHEPYLTYVHNTGYSPPKITCDTIDFQYKKDQNKRTMKMFKNIWGVSIFLINKFDLLGKKPWWKTWKIRKFLNLPPKTPMEFVLRRVGDTGLRQLYLENLKIVLEHVAELVEMLSGVILITSDHGELLGEDGCYDHGVFGSTNPLIREVPWFRIEIKNKRENQNNSEKRGFSNR